MSKNRRIHCMLFALLLLVFAQPLFAQIGISVSFGPPALPVYEQPLCPEEGYIWTPGYWAYDEEDGYYWVPGTWVEAPQPGYLWTPGWWGWGGSAFLFHEGYWGPHVGFYGGINYGHGYFGNGFEGGRWDGGHFFYNRAVSNVNVTNIHNTYNTTVVNNVTNVNRVSYNGGNGGLTARATPEQQTWAQERHLAPVPAQAQHLQTARANPQLRASANQGKPPIAATDRPAAFNGHGVVAAREAGAPYQPQPNRAQPNHGGAAPTNRGPAPSVNPTHASELQPHQAATPASTGNPKQDQRYQQQQAQLVAKQNQQHQQLQAQQEQQHQRMAQQQAQQQQRNAQQQQNQARQQQMAQQNQARQQQMEQQHQQQTQRMEQQHTQQQQHLQERQTGGGGHGGGRPR